MEHNETEWDAAIRETEEESGLFLHKDFLCDDNSKKIESIYTVKKGQKRVVYFMGSVLPTAMVRLSHESVDMKWLSLDELKTFIKFHSMLLVFEQAEDYLKKEV